MSKNQKLFFLSALGSSTSFILFFFYSMGLFEEVSTGLIILVAAILSSLGAILYLWVKKNKKEVEDCFKLKL